MDAPTRRPAIPLGMVGMIAVVALVETGLGRSDRFGSDIAESWRIKASAASREAPKCDVLCFGDSLVEFGLVPPILEERLGGKAYNLATHAGSPAASYFLLKRALAAGARPRAIVVDFMPHQVVNNPGHEAIRLRAWPELAGLGDAIDLGWTMWDGNLFGSILTGKVFTSMKARPEIRKAIVTAIDGGTRSVDEAMLVPMVHRNLKSNRGGYLMPTSFRPAPDPAPGNTDFTSGDYDPVRLTYMDRFLRLAKDRGIPVYWVVMPISPEYQRMADASSGGPQYSELIRRVVARYPNVVALDGRWSGYGPGRFIDSIHLDGDGAAALTNEVADLILRPKSGSAPRLVPLAVFRPRPPSRDLEDVIESKAALARAWAERTSSPR